MKLSITIFVPIFLFAQSYSLKNFIEHSIKTNGNIKAKTLLIQAKSKEVQSAQSAYWPTLDIGGDVSLRNPKYLVSPSKVTNIQAQLNYELYDGGKKDALLKAKRYEQKVSIFEQEAFKKNITLQIIQDYYNIKKLKSNLKALQERAKELKAQIIRIKKFKNTGLATQEDIDKLQAVYDSNAYNIANTKLAITQSKENLKLISGLSAQHLKNNYLKEPKNIQFEYSEQIKIMQSNANAIAMNAKAIDANYMPQVNLSDTYYKSHYDDMVSMPGSDAFLMDHQNTVSLSVKMRLFDNENIHKQSQSLKYQKLAILSQLQQAKKEQKMKFILAKTNLKTLKIKLKSAKSALKATIHTYSVIRHKFEVGLVDNITFLDALTQKIFSEARYKASIYDYEIAKSLYYYYAGKDPKEFIK